MLTMSVTSRDSIFTDIEAASWCYETTRLCQRVIRSLLYCSALKFSHKEGTTSDFQEPRSPFRPTRNHWFGTPKYRKRTRKNPHKRRDRWWNIFCFSFLFYCNKIPLIPDNVTTRISWCYLLLKTFFCNF